MGKLVRLMTPYQHLVDEWKDCTRCHLHKVREKVVLARGRVPADVVFIGEAPGESEDMCGVPFIGPAGKLLDLIIGKVLPTDEETGTPTIRCAITNLVACIPRSTDPRDTEDGKVRAKAEQPPDESIEACSPRLVEFVRLCAPKLLVAVGKLAEDWLKPGYKHSIKFHARLPIVNILHPAYILRASVAQQGLLVQRTIVQLRNALEDSGLIKG